MTDQSQNDSDNVVEQNRGNQLSRRSILGATGTAVIGTSIGVPGAAAAEEGGFTVVEGETMVIDEDHYIGHGQIQIDGDLVIDGDVTFRFDGFETQDRGAHLGITGGGSITFENKGDTLWIDQTAENLGVATRLDDGFQMGDGKGRIIFDGTVDLTHQSRGEGQTFMFIPPETGSAEVNGVAWPSGSAELYENSERGEEAMASDIGFSWAGFESDLKMKNCWIYGFSHNTFYYRVHEGSLTLENCLIEYSGSRGVGVPQGGLDIRDSTIVIGSVQAYQLFSWEATNTAFQLEGDGSEDHPREVYIENVDVIYDTCEEHESDRVELFGTWNNFSDFEVEIVNSRYDDDSIDWGEDGESFSYDGEFKSGARSNAIQSKRDQVFTHGKPERRSFVDCGRVN
jgi:hypothetical protein